MQVAQAGLQLEQEAVGGAVVGKYLLRQAVHSVTPAFLAHTLQPGMVVSQLAQVGATALVRKSGAGLQMQVPAELKKVAWQVVQMVKLLQMSQYSPQAEVVPPAVT